MQFIRQNATHKVVLGPAVAVGDGFTPITTLALTTADEAEVILHDNGTVVSISAYTWAAITTADGYYHLTLQSGISGTVGHMTVVVNDDSLCLPLRADFCVIEEAAYDLLFKASALGYVDGATVDATKVGGTTQTGRDLGASVLLSSGTGTGQVSLSSGAVLLQATQTGVTIPTVTTLTGHTAQTGDSFARIGAAGASLTDLGGMSTTMKGQVNTEADTALTDYDAPTKAELDVLGTAALATEAKQDIIDTNVDTLITKLTTGITSLAEWLGLILGKQAGDATALTEVKATGAGSGTYDPTTDALEAIRDTAPMGSTMVGTDNAALATALTTAQNDLDTITGSDGATLATTQGLYAPAKAGDAMALTSGERDSVATALLDLAAGVETNRTLRQAMRLILAANAGKLSGAATSTNTIRDTNDTVDRIIATVDADGNRSAVTLDAT